MRNAYYIISLILVICIGCQWSLKPSGKQADAGELTIERYDRIEALFLTAGDYAALQQMNTVYPMQTRTLIEDMLHIGHVNDEDINNRFYFFFQDSVLQQLIADVQEQYTDISDISEQMNDAFEILKKKLPTLEMPHIYTQIGSFDQSIVVAGNNLGISLDKYLGSDYPFYQQHYSERQRQAMVRSMIVPDCIGFYLLSKYPMPKNAADDQKLRDQHVGRIQWVVNQVMKDKLFDSEYVDAAEQLMNNSSRLSYERLLRYL